MLKHVFLAISILLSIDSLLRFVLLVLRAIAPDRPAFRDSKVAGAIVLISAHNEAGTIGDTVAELSSQLSEWPETRLWVIADRCSDRTSDEATERGARIAVRQEGPIGKGAAIDWWISNFRAEWQETSAIVILDADSRLEQGSLRAIAAAIGDGAVAAQAFVTPQAPALTGRLAGWSEVLMQSIDDEARRRMRFPVPLRGTGSAVRTEVLAELSPRLHTLAEDLELDVLLSSRGSRVEFVPGAIVIDPKPRHAAGVSRQRSRWIHGQFQVLGDYWREILSSLFNLGGGARRIAGAWLLLPLLFLRPKVALIGLRIVAVSFAIAFFLAGGSSTSMIVLAVALALDASYYLAGAFIVDDRRTYIRDLMTSPGYAAMWLYSICVALVRRSRSGWLRAGRD